MYRKDWEILLVGRWIVESLRMRLRLSAAPRLGHWWLLKFDDADPWYARPVDMTTARNEAGQVLTGRHSGVLHKWQGGLNGRRVVGLEYERLRLCSSDRHSHWWRIKLDDGRKMYARPVELTTARTAAGTLLSEASGARTSRKRKEARN
jgi:hypothetical protein